MIFINFIISDWMVLQFCGSTNWANQTVKEHLVHLFGFQVWCLFIFKMVAAFSLLKEKGMEKDFGPAEAEQT
ncbi:unnamed protein product [Prunus brigantina]